MHWILWLALILFTLSLVVGVLLIVFTIKEMRKESRKLHEKLKEQHLDRMGHYMD